MFRTEITWKIAEIEDKQCKPCEHSGKSDHIGPYCKNCPVGQKLQSLGKLLTQKTQELREKRNTKPKDPELTKELYLQYKKSKLTDQEVADKYKITIHSIKHKKRKWGLIKTWRPSRENKQSQS
ncbi:zinc-finger domain-containing protein [Halalkalibacter krulwichiae]|nr:zinc-finger domain-containing protein [Halalkalibacter krulwichiae]